MTRLIYARSFVPSDASISLRISSSANAIASTSASLRWAYSVTSAMATLHHLPTEWWDASSEEAGRCGLNAGGRTGLRKSHATTHSVPGPRRHFTADAQCIRNETWVHNQHPSVAKPIRATPGHPVPTFRRRTGSDGNGAAPFVHVRPLDGST